MGFNSVEMCIGPVVPRGGNLIVGSGFTLLFFLVAGIGMCICNGAIGGLVMIAWLMTLFILFVNTRALAAR